MKNISFTLKSNLAYICSTSITVMGIGISTSPFIKVKWNDLTSKEKYTILMEAFDGCQRGVPMPINPDEFSRSILAAFGLKSWKVLYEGGLHCSIDLDTDKDQYCFTPMIYLRKNKSLYGIKGGIERIAASASSAEVITVLEGLLEKLPQLEEEYYANEQSKEEPLI